MVFESTNKCVFFFERLSTSVFGFVDFFLNVIRLLFVYRNRVYGSIFWGKRFSSQTLTNWVRWYASRCLTRIRICRLSSEHVQTCDPSFSIDFFLNRSGQRLVSWKREEVVFRVRPRGCRPHLFSSQRRLTARRFRWSKPTTTTTTTTKWLGKQQRENAYVSGQRVGAL